MRKTSIAGIFTKVVDRKTDKNPLGQPSHCPGTTRLEQPGHKPGGIRNNPLAQYPKLDVFCYSESMRIISGNLKGREFKSPHGHKTHPMSDKIRGALFNILGDLKGLTFLDAFAGSGGLAFEAISRGAKSVVAIDKDSSAHGTLDANVKDLNLGKQIDAVRDNTGGWSIHNMENKFDVVLLDPPYDQLQTDLLQTLADRHVKPGGLAVLSFPGKVAPPGLNSLKIIENKNYGDAQLVFYRKV